ncbi:MAG TPA: glycosyltransferase family 2 protein [Longimicrobiales bacterium]|nr:glycosyltransferase family 2 protein [Longimicrobiales bacterium]
MIYICIPSHNEERTVGVLLWKIRQVMTGFPRDYQVLVLDDASTDGTAQVLAPYARILPLVVLRHEQRRGYAASLDELLREAARRSEYPRRDVIVTLQADFTEEPDDIPELLKRIESGADVVTSRVELQPTLPRRIRWTRRLLSRVLRRLGWPESVTDVLSGFRAYRVLGVRKALEARGGARLLQWSDVWAANAALLREVQPHVRRVDEVPVRLRSDRRQRPSRFEPKESAFQLLRLAFGRRAPDAVPPREGGPALVPTTASVVADRGAPREGSQNGGARRDRSGRGGAPPGRRAAAPRTATGGASAEDAARRSSRPRRAAAEGAARNGGPRRPRPGGGAPTPAPTDAPATEAPPP